MKKSTNRDSRHPKLTLRREAIALLAGAQLGEVRGGGDGGDSTTDRTRHEEDGGFWREQMPR
jgi:hypothetical protein